MDKQAHEWATPRQTAQDQEGPVCLLIKSPTCLLEVFQKQDCLVKALYSIRRIHPPTRKKYYRYKYD